MPTAPSPPPLYLQDVNGHAWLVAVGNDARPNLTGPASVPAGFVALPFVLLNDAATGATWRLIVLPSPAQPAYPPADFHWDAYSQQTGIPTQILVSAPNGIVYALQISNGDLQSLLPPPSSFNCSTAISTLAANVQDRMEEPRGAGIFWDLATEVYTAIVEGMNDMMMLVGRPTISVNVPLNLVPNTVWQPLPKGLFLITDIIGAQSALRRVSLHDLDYVQSSWGCYDCSTEVLTYSGWKYFSELSGGELFAALDIATGEMKYERASAYHAYRYSGDMVNFDGQSVDLSVTPNHNILFRQVVSKQWRKQRADSIGVKNFRFKRDALWHRDDVEYTKIGKHIIRTDVWMEFLGYFISEGHTSKNTFIRGPRKRTFKFKLVSGKIVEKEYLIPSREETNYTVAVSQTHPEKRKKIRACLDKLPVKFSKDGAAGWKTGDKHFYNYLSVLGEANSKFIPWSVKEMSKRQQRILLDALILGDGHIGKPSWTYYTSSKRLADDVQELALRCGYAGTIGSADRRGRIASSGGVTRDIEYRVCISMKQLQPSFRARHPITKSHYDGMVYCVTVPSGVIYVRRNGKAVWCGNSSWENDTSVTGPLRWAPIGMTMFAVHPAPSVPVQVNINAVAYPVAEPWPYNGSEVVPFQHEFHDAIEEYAACYLRLKEGGTETMNGVKLYDSYLARTKRMTEIQDRRDPVLFTPSYGAVAGINALPRR